MIIQKEDENYCGNYEKNESRLLSIQRSYSSPIAAFFISAACSCPKYLSIQP